MENGDEETLFAAVVRPGQDSNGMFVIKNIIKYSLCVVLFH